MVKYVYYSVACVIVVWIIEGRIQGHPHGRLVGQRWYNYPGPEVNVSYNQEAGIKNADVNLRQQIDSNDEIIFPSELPENGPKNYILPPAAECASATFCENPPDYPSDFIKNAIKSRKDFKHLATIDEISEIGQRFDADSDEPLCIYEDKVIFPKTAESKDNEWLYVVNEADFPQGIRIEECLTDENTGCRLVDNFSEGYTTSCKQKYIYRQLVSVATNGILDINYFRFPASCCCHVKFRGDAQTRFGTFASGGKGKLQNRLNKHQPKT